MGSVGTKRTPWSPSTALRQAQGDKDDCTATYAVYGSRSPEVNRAEPGRGERTPGYPGEAPSPAAPARRRQLKTAVDRYDKQAGSDLTNPPGFWRSRKPAPGE